MNHISLLGRATKDTDLNGSGKVATNSIAVDRSMKDANGNKVTDFVNLKWLGEPQAQFARKYISKGTKFAVEGSLCIDNYKDNNGNNRQAVYVKVDKTHFCESKSQGESKPASTPHSVGDGWMNIPYGIDEEMPWK